MGTDVAPAATQRDKVYIYYPMNKRYGLEPKGKPRPQQWTQIQILTSADSAEVRWINGAPQTSISMNSLSYLTTTTAGANVGRAASKRSCLSCTFDVPVVTALTPLIADKTVMMASDSHAFYGFQFAATDTLNDPVWNSLSENCISFGLYDKFNDGWGIASLVITSPSGQEDRYTSQCTTANPQIFKYCPHSQVPGKYTMHIENGMETPFGWEIYWKVAIGSTWFVGDRHTRMEFIWDPKYSAFYPGATKNLLPLLEVCEICDPNKPASKHRSLSNLRSLHHKGVTSSPTISSAPTLTTTGYTNTLWNEFTFIGTAKWFGVPDSYEGANFFISDQAGKHLFKTGTRCTAGTGAEKCWVDIPDGDYTLRVGSGVQDLGASSFTYAFCESSNPIEDDTELKFTILDQQCYAGLFTTVNNKCMTNYKAEWYLHVDLLLNGATEALSSRDKNALQVALSETMLSVLGSSPTSSEVQKQDITSSGLKVAVRVEFASVPDSTAVDNFAKDTSSATSLLKYELIGGQALSANFLKGEVSGVSIVSVSNDANVLDLSKVDESSFKTVTDHVWLTAAVDPPSDTFNVYARYIAEGTYAFVAVATVLAVSLFVKRVMSKTAPEVAKGDVEA